MVPPASHRVPRVRWYSGTGCVVFSFKYGTLTLFGAAFQPSSSGYLQSLLAGPQPLKSEDSKFGLFPVRSPLLRKSFVIFFSSGYLDVSVHRVPSVQLWIHCTVTVLYFRRVSPFGHLWVKAYLQLTTAYRSLSRPSSALDAKAFTLRSY